jgi:hypothetical protein
MDGKIIFLLAAASLAGGGCATQQVWDNPDKTHQQFYQDMTKCETMSNSAGSQQIAPAYFPPGQANNPMASFAQGWNMGSASNTAASRQRIFDNCMRGEGWALTEER